MTTEVLILKEEFCFLKSVFEVGDMLILLLANRARQSRGHRRAPHTKNDGPEICSF